MENNIPKHIAIIMDGNRRWAKDKGLTGLQGHKAGYDRLKEVGDWCLEAGIEILTVYAFSTENWNRPKTEVSYLMKLFHHALTNELEEYNKKGIRLQVIGRKEGLSKTLQKEIINAEEVTKDNKKGTINLAINYGGRAEITDAIKSIVKDNIKEKDINEALVEHYLYTKAMKDPDLIIRTSGEQRLSGFLIWQGVYSELYFTNAHWPDFTKKEFNKALDSYGKRKRRFGGNDKKTKK